LAEIINQGFPTTPHFTGMGQKTANIDIRVEPQLVEKIDAWRGPAASASKPNRGDRLHDRAVPQA
jgi:hypothetical protein